MPENRPSEADNEIQLPCPTPRPEAVEAGRFGMTPEGPLSPDPVEVAALTEEHGNELTAILADCMYFEWCRKHSLNPRTGRPQKRPAAADELKKKIEAELTALERQYRDALFAYEEAFGNDAAAALDRFVRRRVGQIEGEMRRPIQKTLF